MKYCTKCGGQMLDDAAFCPACGAAASQSQEQNQGSGQQNYYQQNQGSGQQNYSYQQQGYYQAQVNYNDPMADAQANKVYGILAYINLLVLISIFAAPKESKYSRFHANQGLVLLIASVIFNIGLFVIYAILSAILALSFSWGLIAAINIIFAILYSAVGMGSLALMIIGIINAAKGDLKRLPVIGHFNILK